MLFLMRLAFWLMIIVLLLPSTQEDNKRLMATAERTVSDIGGFCGRNPDVCEAMRSAASSLLQKVENGLTMINWWVSGEDDGKDGARLLPDGEGAPPAIVLQPRWNNNLTDADKRIPWRGPTT